MCLKCPKKVLKGRFLYYVFLYSKLENALNDLLKRKKYIKRHVFLKIDVYDACLLCMFYIHKVYVYVTCMYT